MADVIHPTYQTVSLPAVTSHYQVEQPSSTSEYNLGPDDPFSSTVSTIGGQPLSAQIPRTSWSRNASPGSFVEHIYSEKIPEKSPRRRLHRQSTLTDRRQTVGSKGSYVAPTPLRNGTYGDSMADDLSKSATPQKHRSGGLRTAIRRIFGRKSAKNRISLPAPVEVRHTVSYLTYSLTLGEQLYSCVTSEWPKKKSTLLTVPFRDLQRPDLQYQ